MQVIFAEATIQVLFDPPYIYIIAWLAPLHVILHGVGPSQDVAQKHIADLASAIVTNENCIHAATAGSDPTSLLRLEITNNGVQ